MLYEKNLIRIYIPDIKPEVHIWLYHDLSFETNNTVQPSSAHTIKLPVIAMITFLSPEEYIYLIQHESVATKE